MLLSNLRQRVTRNEGGFTLIELLVVLIIIAVLLAIAVPSYLKFKERAEERAAASNVRSAIPAAEAWYSDNSTYAGMEAPGALTGIDSGIKVTNVTVTADGNGYCIASTHNGEAGGKAVHKMVGPGGKVVPGDCA
jgi:prepilin-type N-terminal cleavage/methylation domain-containing protein